jgi:hypothetical protein
MAEGTRRSMLNRFFPHSQLGTRRLTTTSRECTVRALDRDQRAAHINRDYLIKIEPTIGRI